jgi:hypothetical protein
MLGPKIARKRCVSLSRAYVPRRLFANEPPRSARAQARHAGRTLFIICGVIALIVAIVFGARLHTGGPIAPLSVALPVLGLSWLVVLAVQVSRYRPPVEAAPARHQHPSKRAPRFEPSSGVRADRPSDSGTHASA